MGNFNMPFNWTCQTQTMFNDPECKEIMNLLMLSKEGRDWSLGFRYQGMAGQGGYTATYMQSLSKSIQAGFQMNYMVSIFFHLNPNFLYIQPHLGKCDFGYAGYYQIGSKLEHQFAASYSPMQQKDTINISYITKPSKRLQLFAELKGKEDGSSSESQAGFRLKFMEGSITGYFTSNQKAFATYSKSLEGNAMKMDFNTQLDFKNARKPCMFGINLNVGMM